MSRHDFHEFTTETARNYWNFNQTRAKAIHFAAHLELLEQGNRGLMSSRGGWKAA